MRSSAQSCMLGRKVICVRCINYSYNDIAKGIRLIDKLAILFIQEKSHTSKSFWKKHPLKHSLEIASDETFVNQTKKVNM